MLVKFQRPVGGALMQCFKAWERTGQQRRGEEKRVGEDAAAGAADLTEHPKEG